MNLSQAIEHANTLVFPAFLTDDLARTAEREKNEEAIGLLTAAWMDAPAGAEPYPFDLVRGLADRNRELCDLIGEQRLRDLRGTSLAQHLSDDDLVRSAAALQHRDVAEVRRTAGPGLRDMGVAYVESTVSGMVAGVDIETTSRYPDRGYIINVGLQFVRLAPKGRARTGYAAYCGIPNLYADKGVPLANIHQITWKDLDGKQSFRENATLQRALLMAFETFPYLAHNAAFEDSWFMLHLNGYAESRKAGRIVPVDTRDICRRIDPEVRTLPHDAKPAALETWARRRKTLKANEKERHLGLDDVDLMIRTVEAEFAERNMFAE
ncbi:MAG: 3'-5' exonuclease [Coriobacteriales bacterium]|nr:3'-5' exonuclease [Coriobacteriales bacterium]